MAMSTASKYQRPPRVIEPAPLFEVSQKNFIKRVSRKIWQRSLLSLSLLAGLGCGSDGKVMTTGDVLWNDQSLASGNIQFLPADGKGPVEGVDVTGGKFQIRMQPGEKIVRVTATRQIGEKVATEAGRDAVHTPTVLQYIPSKFNDKSELRVTVASASEPIKLDLKGTERKPGDKFEVIRPYDRSREYR